MNYEIPEVCFRETYVNVQQSTNCRKEPFLF